MDFFKKFKALTHNGNFVSISLIDKDVYYTDIPNLIHQNESMEDLSAYIFNCLPKQSQSPEKRIKLTQNLLKCEFTELNVSSLDKLN